jgi:hypothetical protein
MTWTIWDSPRIKKAVNRSPFLFEKYLGQPPSTQAVSSARPAPVKIRSFSHPFVLPLMTKKPHVTIHRKDYTAPAHWVNTVEMGFDLDPAATRVATRITLQRNSASPNKDVELLGDGVKLVALRMNGKTLRKGAPNNRGGYSIADGKLCTAEADADAELSPGHGRDCCSVRGHGPLLQQPTLLGYE